MGSPPCETGKAAAGGSSWIVFKEQQSRRTFIFDSGRTNQSNKKHVNFRYFVDGFSPIWNWKGGQERFLAVCIRQITLLEHFYF